MFYFKALNIAGENIFTVSGYINLRTAFTEYDQSYGIMSYLIPLFFVSYSLTFYNNFKKGLLNFKFIILTISALFYVYISTGRTFALLLFALILFPLIIQQKVSKKALAISGIVLIFIFVGIASMTAKGGYDPELNFEENVQVILNPLRSYTVAPFIAMGRIHDRLDQQVLEMGINSFRFFFAILSGLHLVDAPPSLIKSYEQVPDMTNVYTVYEVYVKDFGILGYYIPVFLLIMHWNFYIFARKYGGIWIFICSFLYYPLIMQFFQDQYFSLLSTWIQMIVWYAIFVKYSPNKIKYLNNVD